MLENWEIDYTLKQNLPIGMSTKWGEFVKFALYLYTPIHRNTRKQIKISDTPCKINLQPHYHTNFAQNIFAGDLLILCLAQQNWNPGNRETAFPEKWPFRGRAFLTLRKITSNQNCNICWRQVKADEQLTSEREFLAIFKGTAARPPSLCCEEKIWRRETSGKRKWRRGNDEEGSTVRLDWWCGCRYWKDLLAVTLHNM